MDKNKNKNKKEEVFVKRDLSLKGLLTSHLSDFKKDLVPSSQIYNGAMKSPRWAGVFSKSKIFTLSHYNTPILNVNIAKSSADLIDLPSDRKVKGLSNGDLRGINTTLEVLGIKFQAKKRAGVTRLLYYSIN